MSRRKARKDAGRPRIPSRRVYEDWFGGVRVVGYESTSGDIVYLLYLRGYRGNVLATTHYPQEWWESLSHPTKMERHTSYVQKALGAASPSGKGAAASDADLAASCPALHEFLTLCQLPDGSARTPATLLVFSEGGLWKACLNERDAGLNLWATAESLQSLWCELEARLTAPVVDWRPSKRPAVQKAPPVVVDKPKRKR